MDGDTLRVQCGDTRGRQDHVALVRAGGQLVQEGGLAGTGFTREENMAIRAVDEPRGQGGHFGFHVLFGGGTVQVHFAKVGSAGIMREGHFSWLYRTAPAVTDAISVSGTGAR